MKKVTILLLLFIIIAISHSEDVPIPPDKACHFAVGAITCIGADIIADQWSLPAYAPFIAVSIVAFGKEAFDKNFVWEDISYCYLGFSFGFAIRWLDSLQYENK